MFNLRWLPLAAGVLAGALLAGGVQQYRVMSVERALVTAERDHSLAVAKAEAAYADALKTAARLKDEAQAKTDALTALASQVEEDSRDAEIQRDVERAAAGAERERLLDQYARLEADARARDTAGSPAATAPVCEAAYSTLRVLADVRRESSARAIVRAEFAERAYEASARCTMIYDGARAASEGGN